MDSESGHKGIAQYNMQSSEYCGLQYRCTRLSWNLLYLSGPLFFSVKCAILLFVCF